MTNPYTYDTGKKNAVVQVENTDNLIQGAASLTYNAFNKVATVVQGTNTLTITYGPDRQRTKTVLANGSNTTTTLYADNYEQRTANGVTTSYHYVGSPDGLAAVYVKSGNTATAYYIETDHLGSIIRAYDYIGNTKFSAAYDAWGNQTVSTNAIGLTRGYTGHEHWPQFGLIDMNGRFYDPLLGRFLSPDPYVQAPDNPQNYNRYSYCLNNPLKYTDPDGEKWWHWVVGATFLLDPVSTSITACATATAAVGVTTAVAAVGLTPYQGTLTSVLIPSKNYGKKVKNAFKIDTYNYRAKNFWHLVSRFTWESPQTGLGNLYSQIRNLGGNVDRVDYFDGATFCTNENTDDNNGITLGNYININIEGEIDTDFETYLRTSNNGLFMHEYGHTIQGRRFGLSYLLVIGIPSLRSASHSGPHPLYRSTHCVKWFEREASRYAKDYFGSDWNNIANIDYYHPTYY